MVTYLDHAQILSHNPKLLPTILLYRTFNRSYVFEYIPFFLHLPSPLFMRA